MQTTKRWTDLSEACPSLLQYDIVYDDGETVPIHCSQYVLQYCLREHTACGAV